MNQREESEMMKEISLDMCDKCGKSISTTKPPMDYARSVEWIFDGIREINNNMDSGDWHYVRLCAVCKRQLQAILYNWFQGLTLTHQPFMPY